MCKHKKREKVVSKIVNDALKKKKKKEQRPILNSYYINFNTEVNFSSIYLTKEALWYCRVLYSDPPLHCTTK